MSHEGRPLCASAPSLSSRVPLHFIPSCWDSTAMAHTVPLPQANGPLSMLSAVPSLGSVPAPGLPLGILVPPLQLFGSYWNPSTSASLSSSSAAFAVAAYWILLGLRLLVCKMGTLPPLVAAVEVKDQHSKSGAGVLLSHIGKPWNRPCSQTCVHAQPAPRACNQHCWVPGCRSHTCSQW